jgi:uncharacterized protein YndB with AHSA1/START domain
MAPDVVRRTIVVRCGQSAAFQVFTAQLDRWWPKSHSRSGNPDTTVLLEQRVGGRLYERTPDGAEHIWGQVIAWDPPRHLAYHWYLGSGSERPSRVDASFSDRGDGQTQVEIEHRGPELIGELWLRNNAIYAASWEHLLQAYDAVIASIE